MLISRYLSPSAERERTITVESTGSGSTFLSSFRSTLRVNGAGLRVLDRLDRLDEADPDAADPHLVAADQRVGVRHLDRDPVGGHERQAVVGVVGEEDGEDHDQGRDRADQRRAGGDGACSAAGHRRSPRALDGCGRRSRCRAGRGPRRSDGAAAPVDRRRPLRRLRAAARGVALGVERQARAPARSARPAAAGWSAAGPGAVRARSAAGSRLRRRRQLLGSALGAAAALCAADLSAWLRRRSCASQPGLRARDAGRAVW